MIKDDNSGSQDSGMDELQFDDIDSMLGSNEPEPSKSGGLEDLSIEADPLESLVASSGEEYPTSFENDFSFHPEETSSSTEFNLDEDSLDLELTDPLIDAEIDKLLDIGDLASSHTSNISNLESDDSFFIPADENEQSDEDFSELDSYLTEEPDAISFGEELDDLDEFGLPDDLHEEGPISLHEDDLQGVKPDFSLQDFTMDDDHPAEELDHGDLSFDEDDFLNEEEGPISLSEDELGEIAYAETPMPDFSNPVAEEEENITLSDSELGGILDANEEPDWSSGPAMTLDDTDDEGPIALSGNELDDILGTGAEEQPAAQKASDVDEELPDFITHTDDIHEEEIGVPSLSDETGFDFASADSLGSEEDEGPIALSEDELGNLLADNVEEEGVGTPSSTMDSFGDLDISDEVPTETSSFDFEPESGSLLDGGEAEAEEPIALSTDELDHILTDDAKPETLDEISSSMMEESGFDFASDDSLASSLDEEDNEPIALSEEELGNLLSDETSLANEEPSTDGFGDLLHDDGSLPEDTGSLFSEDDTFSLPVEQDLGGPDEFGLTQEGETIPDHSDFSFEPTDSVLALEEDDEGEPIALSEEELGNLLSSDVEEEAGVPSTLEESGFDFETPDSSGEEDDLISLPVSELDGIGQASMETSASLDDDALSFDDFELPTNDLDSLETETPADSFIEDAEDNEPIALSDEELGNLLADNVEEEGVGTPSSTMDSFGDLDISDEVPTETSSFDFEPESGSLLDGGEAEAEEPIALSTDELDHILTDNAEATTTEEFPGADSEIDWDAPLAETTDSDLEAEEPIALSTDELDHILTDNAEATATEEFPGADSEIDWDAPLSEQEEVPLEDEEPIALSTDELDHILTSEEPTEEDEGPIALSEDELGNLLSDVQTPEEDGEDLNEILGELPVASDLDAFESMDEDVSALQPLNGESGIVPTAETVQDEEMVIVLDEYADEEELSPLEELRKTPEEPAAPAAPSAGGEAVPSKDEMKRIMTYLDELLGNLPDDLIREFSQSDYFELYKKLMKQIGV
ncbi:midas domain-containing protein [Leptospira sanjuanensis]|uniref:hypothetical protein n=1 Tax=Leptospira sanjuanensis TaxID=2879643 RepID=UPI001EE8582D|nr:hypothetical protein [Leptospira sanjuanensis]MCG6168698.1 hypothetical protein [Leptospira sanjuanensis]